MSPTAPTFVTLNGRLIKAHSRIRELEASESALIARNSALSAVIDELRCSPDRHESSPC